MDFAEIERKHLTVKQAAERAGVEPPQIYQWSKYHSYFRLIYFMGKPLIRLAEFEAFEQKHPELLKNKEQVAV